MKERYEVLKQIRLYAGYDIVSFTKKLGFSSVSYVQNVERGVIENVEYIYERYAKVLGIRQVTLKTLIKDSEKNHYTSQEIASEIKRMLKVD